MKKILIGVFLILSFMNNKIIAANNLNYFEKTKEVRTISHLSHQHITANMINDKGGSSLQNINILRIQEEDQVEIAVWSYFTDFGSLLLKNVIDLAKDFEAKNPGYEVLAGVNADYFFYPPNLVNANLIFGSKLIKPYNHIKYLSVLMDKDGEFLKTIKQLKLADSYSLYLYDEITGALLYKEAIIDFNKPANREGTYLYTPSFQGLSSKHFVGHVLMQSSLENANFYSGKIIKESTTSLSNQQLGVYSTNMELNTLLTKNPLFKIQKDTSDFEEGDQMVGVDSHVLRAGELVDFSVIGGQDVNHNESRHPRTALGFDINNKPVLITVDGRQAGFSNGVDLRELALIMKENNLYNGFNLDGGGSTQMIIKEDGVFKMINRPSESPYRAVGNAIFFIKPKVKEEVVVTKDENIININAGENTTIFHNGKLVGNEFTIDEEVNNVIAVIKDNFAIFNKVIDKIKLPPVYNYSSFDRIDLKRDNNKWIVDVYYSDDDLMVDGMRITHLISGDKKVALLKTKGHRQAIFEDLEINDGDEFIISYDLSNFEKKEYSFVFEEKIVKKTGCFAGITANPLFLTSISILLGSSVLVILRKRKKIN